VKIRGRYYNPTLTEAQYREALAIAARQRAIPTNKELCRKHDVPLWWTVHQAGYRAAAKHEAFWADYSAARIARKEWLGLLEQRAKAWNVKAHIISKAISHGIKTYDRASCAASTSNQT
jgi:hypothetical protein